MPTYNRHSYALRNIDFWRNSNALLLVLDGSDNPLDFSLISNLPNNIRYIHSNTPMYERIKSVLGFIETKYVVLLGDNQFFIYSALNKCILELESNTELVACMGRTVQFGYSGSKITWDIIYKDIRNISEDDGYSRIKNLFSNYVPTSSYAVVRSEYWKLAMKIASFREYPAFALGELQFEILLAYFGKIKVLPVLMWLRSLEVEKIRKVDISDNHDNTFLKWWLSDESKYEKHQMLSNMNSALKEQFDSVNFEEIFDIYANKRIIYDAKNQIGAFKISIKNKIPNKIIISYRYAKNIIIKKLSTIRSHYALHKLEASGIYIDFTELSSIKKIIHDFNKVKSNI